MKYYTEDREQIFGYDFYCDIAENMALERKACGFTQKQLSEKSKVEASRITEMESARTRPILSELKRVSEALGISVDKLIGADLTCGGKECLFLVWVNGIDDLKLYIKATSAEMSTLLFYERLRTSCRLDPTNRFRSKLVGIPVEDAEIQLHFKKRRNSDGEYDSIGKEA